MLFNSCATTSSKQPDKVSIKQLIREQGYKVTVYFDVSSAELGIVSQDELMHAAKLQGASKTSAYLTGHADKTGIKENNIDLSEMRVLTVKNYLMSLGIKEENVFIDYFGDEKPVDENEDLEAYAKNRRVEVILTNQIDDVIVGRNLPKEEKKYDLPAASSAAEAVSDIKSAVKEQAKPEYSADEIGNDLYRALLPDPREAESVEIKQISADEIGNDLYMALLPDPRDNSGKDKNKSNIQPDEASNDVNIGLLPDTKH